MQRVHGRSPGWWMALVALAAGCAAARVPVEPAVELPLGETVLAVPAEAPPPAPVDRRPTGSGELWYVVAPGDTAWRIAQAHEVTVDALAWANALADPARLPVGQRLRIPLAPGLSPDRAPVEGTAGPSLAPLEAEPGATSLAPLEAEPGVTSPAPLEAEPGATGLAPLLGWPVPGGRILSRFGDPRGNRAHGGLDIGGRSGEPVLAAEAGHVVYAASGMRGYGQTVILDHGAGLRTLYAHNSKLLVREGQAVRRGQPIAQVGRSGNATTDHCHFEVRRANATVDPFPLLMPQNAAARRGAESGGAPGPASDQKRKATPP